MKSLDNFTNKRKRVMEYRFEIDGDNLKIYRNGREISIEEYFDDVKSSNPECIAAYASLEKLFESFNADIELQLENITQDSAELSKSWDALLRAASNLTNDVGKMFEKVVEAGATFTEVFENQTVTPQGEVKEQDISDIKAKADEILARKNTKIPQGFREVLEKLATLQVATLSYQKAGQEAVVIKESDLPKFYENNAQWLIEELTSCQFFLDGKPITGNQFLIELRKLSS
jgi:hypothetical protein